mmetsp:Transcript_13411/g.20065  ORF Transcript_13411/g.20065 Transcript_13411/m.20065 type:complete len:184 (+) Transcript_13411:154-705(+)
MKSWLTSPTAIPKRIVKNMVKTVARQLTKTVMVNVSGMITVTNVSAAAAAATETTAETSLTEVIVLMKIVSGRMVNAVSPVSALGAATSTTVAAANARMKAAHGIAALVIAVWCAETLKTLTATRARGVDTVFGTVVIATSGQVIAATWTILAGASARTIPIMSAIGKTATVVANLTIAKKRR